MSRQSLSRRSLLRAGRDLSLLALLPAEVLSSAGTAAAEAETRFLTREEIKTLTAICGRLIPGPPHDRDPGAIEAGVPAYIDMLLGAFEVSDRPIFGGGPFSDRNGVGGPYGPPHDGSQNDYAEFLDLDAIEELTWRTRIEGSLGIPEREWNGPVTGLQEIYRAGLTGVDGVAQRWARRRFHAVPDWLQDVIVLFPPPQLREFVDTVFGHCAEGMYGPPEYGGNRDSVGWIYTGWPGDSQPRGFSPGEVSGA